MAWPFRFLLPFLLALFCIIEGFHVDEVPILPTAEGNVHQRLGKIAICAIFQDEAPFLKEWIEYHLLVGVSHFYLYNNLSQDNYQEVLAPYLKSGVVELFQVPFDSYEKGNCFPELQVCCYNHAIKLSGKLSRWLAIIDLDEFICPVIDQTLTDALDRYSYANGLVVYWQNYGTSNVWELQPRELLIEKLLYKEPLRTEALFKTIVRPDGATCLDPHLTVPKKGPLIAPNHQPFSHTPGFTALPVDVIRINHYTHRTASYYYNFKLPRRARWGDCPDAELIKAREDYCNVICDPTMLRFVPKLKSRMF